MFGAFGALTRRSGLIAALTVGLGLAIPGIAQAAGNLSVSTSPTSGVTCTGSSPLVCSPSSSLQAYLNTTDLENYLKQGSVELSAYAINISSPLTLPSDLTLQAPSGGIIADDSIDGPGALTVGSGFDAYGSLGANAPLASFASQGFMALESGANSIVTSGNQTYDGQLDISGASTLDSSAGNGDITFGTVQGESVIPYGTGDPGLTVNARTGTVSIPGTLGTDNYVNQDKNLGNVEVTGATIDLPPAVFSTGSATFNGASVVGDSGSDLAISGPASFSSTVTGADSTSTSNGLDIQGSSASFGGAVSDINSLSVVQASNPTQFVPTTLGGDVSTTGGGQNYYGPVTLGSDAALSDSGDQTILIHGGASLAGHTLTAGDGQTDLEQINDDTAGKVVADGGGTLSLAGTNDVSGTEYTGGTSVSGGATIAFEGGSLGPGPISIDGGTLDWNNTTQDISPQGISVGPAGATFDTGGNDVSFSQPVAGTGGITVAGGGSLALASTNSYTGPTTINGTLVFGPDSLANTSSVDLNGGTLQWGSGNSDDVSSQLTIDNTNGGTLDVGANHVTLAGNLSSTGPVQSTGSGTLTLAGTDSIGSTANANALVENGAGELLITGTLNGRLKLASGTLGCNTGSTIGTINAPFTNQEGSSGIASGSLPATPGTPTVTPENGQASVAFSRGAATCDPTTYKVTATPTSGGSPITATGNTSPITISGLTNGQSYKFSVVAHNPLATSSASPASAAVTPRGPIGVFQVGHVTVSKTRVVEQVTCSPAGAACELTVSLTTKEKVKKKLRSVSVGQVTVTLAPGTTQTISVALSHSAVKRLHKLGRLSVTVTTSEPNGGSVRHSVKFKYHRKRG